MLTAYEKKNYNYLISVWGFIVLLIANILSVVITSRPIELLRQMIPIAIPVIYEHTGLDDPVSLVYINFTNTRVHQRKFYLIYEGWRWDKIKRETSRD